jgi:hypothetical protein
MLTSSACADAAAKVVAARTDVASRRAERTENRKFMETLPVTAKAGLRQQWRVLADALPDLAGNGNSAVMATFYRSPARDYCPDSAQKASCGHESVSNIKGLEAF